MLIAESLIQLIRSFLQNQIPLGLVVKAGKVIDFSASIVNVPEGIEVTLVDASYKVTVTENTEGTGQFYLQTSAKPLITYDLSWLSNVAVYNSGKKQLTISGITSATDVSVYSITDKLVYKGGLSTSGTIDLATVSTGVYVVKIQSEVFNVSKKVIVE